MVLGAVPLVAAAALAAKILAGPPPPPPLVSMAFGGPAVGAVATVRRSPLGFFAAGNCVATSRKGCGLAFAASLSFSAFSSP